MNQLEKIEYNNLSSSQLYGLICHSLPELNDQNLDLFKNASFVVCPWERDLSLIKKLNLNSNNYLLPYPVECREELDDRIDANNGSISIYYEGLSESRLHILFKTLAEVNKTKKEIKIIYSEEQLDLLNSNIELLDEELRRELNPSLVSYKSDLDLYEIINDTSFIIYPHYTAIKPLSKILLYSWSRKIPIILGTIDKLYQFPNIYRGYTYSMNEGIELKYQIENLLSNSLENCVTEDILLNYIKEFHSPICYKKEIELLIDKYLIR